MLHYQIQSAAILGRFLYPCFCKSSRIYMFSIYRLKQSDCFAISDYDVIFTALGGEYKAKQNRCRELGVLPSFRVRSFLKYKNIPELTILKVRKDFMVFKQRDFIAKWFTVVDFHTLVAMVSYWPLQRKTRPLCHCFVNLGFPLRTKFAWKQKLIYGEKKESKYFRKLYVPAS